MKYMKFLNSSAIKSAVYDDTTHVLNLTFTSGGSYEYPAVPYKEYEGLINAESAGRYYHTNIKKYAKYS